MKRIKIAELKKYLKDKTEKELTEEIIEMFKVNKQVQEIYNLKVNPENELVLLEEYKSKVEEQFFPSRGMNVLNYGVLKNLVSDFEKVANRKDSVVELLLCYAENGVDFTITFGDIDERFYNNISRIYEKALHLISENELAEKYQATCRSIMEEALDIGWGFGDWMNELFYDYFGGYIEE